MYISTLVQCGLDEKASYNYDALYWDHVITTSLRVSGVYSGRIREWDWHFSPQTSHEYRSRREKGHILGAVFQVATAQLVKNLPAMQETLIWSLGWEDPLEKGQATHSSILGLPWWTQLVMSMGSQRVRCDWVTFTLTGQSEAHFRIPQKWGLRPRCHYRKLLGSVISWQPAPRRKKEAGLGCQRSWAVMQLQQGP